MASIVKCHGTLTVRKDIETQFKNSGHFALLLLLFSSPLKAADNPLLQQGHKHGAHSAVAHFGTPCSEKYAFVFLSLQALKQPKGPGCNWIQEPTGGPRHGV